MTRCAADYFTAVPALTRLSVNGNSLPELPASLATCAALVGVQVRP